MAAHFEPVVNANYRLVAPPPTRRTAIGEYPQVASYDMLSEQLHYSIPVQHGYKSELAMGSYTIDHNGIFIEFAQGKIEKNCLFFACCAKVFEKEY